ncbi:MAG: hypothetical protein OEW33_15430 [Nitrospirota bacterium]|nr:hypothetical protein [Nitrospirota bacterium]
MVDREEPGIPLITINSLFNESAGKETEDLIEPWLLRLGIDPSPLAKDDGLLIALSSHVSPRPCLALIPNLDL